MKLRYGARASGGGMRPREPWGAGCWPVSRWRCSWQRASSPSPAAASAPALAPVTTASPIDTVWHPAPWVITLDAIDAGGVDYVEYSVDGGVWTKGYYPTLVTDGAHSVDYRAVDLAGNVEDAQTMTAKVDVPASGDHGGGRRRPLAQPRRRADARGRGRRPR